LSVSFLNFYFRNQDTDHPRHGDICTKSFVAMQKAQFTYVGGARKKFLHSENYSFIYTLQHVGVCNIYWRRAANVYGAHFLSVSFLNFYFGNQDTDHPDICTKSFVAICSVHKLPLPKILRKFIHNFPADREFHAVAVGGGIQRGICPGRHEALRCLWVDKCKHDVRQRRTLCRQRLQIVMMHSDKPLCNLQEIDFMCGPRCDVKCDRCTAHRTYAVRTRGGSRISKGWRLTGFIQWVCGTEVP